MNKNSRREFLTKLTQAMGTSALLASTTGTSWAHPAVPQKKVQTVGDIMDMIIKTIPRAPFPKTVDTLKSGDASIQVTGITTTMFATLEVIEKSIRAGANFIIAHEPTFYNHLDDTAWLEQDDVYRYKRDLLAKNKIAVWRFHDYWHSHVPDGVRMGVLTALGWEKYQDTQDLAIATIPSMRLSDLVSHAKSKLGINSVRVIGDLAQSCKRVLLMPGAAGGQRQIDSLQRLKPDVLLVGELSEWETAEYVRDARYKGDKLSLVVLGHAVSEEPGMQWLVSWLQPKLPDIKVTHIPANNPFIFV